MCGGTSRNFQWEVHGGRWSWHSRGKVGGRSQHGSFWYMDAYERERGRVLQSEEGRSEATEDRRGGAHRGGWADQQRRKRPQEETTEVIRDLLQQ